MDYINKSFVSLRDLDSIDDKINSLRLEQQALQEKIAQRASAPTDMSVTPVTTTHVASLLDEIRQLTPDTPASHIEALIKEYGRVEPLAHLLNLLGKRTALAQNSRDLAFCEELKGQISSLSSSSPVSDYSRVASSIAAADERHLADLKSEFRAKVSEQREILQNQLHEILSEVHWLAPNEPVKIENSNLQKIRTLVEDLTVIQACVSVPTYPDVWWALETLVEPFAIRFNYHFQEAAKTNKISKPEWALGYVETFLADNLEILNLVTGSMFDKYERIGSFELISAVLVPLRKKMSSTVEIINNSINRSEEDDNALDRFGRLLSHLIFECASFDQTLRARYAYNPFIEHLSKAPERKWMGISGDLLLAREGEGSAVDNWLHLELVLAKKRFENDIIGPDNAFEIDPDYGASSDSPETVLHPTFSAFGLVKLFENLTSHFKTINIVKYQLKYVSKIQLPLLDQYMVELRRHFKQFDVSLRLKLMSNFVPGSAESNTPQVSVTNGLAGLQILTGIYCLTRFMIEKMEVWSGDLVFIQLWRYCQAQSDEQLETSIFDSTISEFRKFLDEVSSKYEDFFRREIRKALKEYVNTTSWIVDPLQQTQVSGALASFINAVLAYMSYTKKVLPSYDYFVVSSKVCNSYAKVLLEYVITNNQFNQGGIDQLSADIDYINTSLTEDLQLDPTKRISNAENKSIKKVQQLLEIMRKFDVSGAKIMKKQFDNGAAVRMQFESKLDALSDSECLDILFRIV